MAACGPVSLSRAAHPLSLPGSQPWVNIAFQPPPASERPISGPVIGVAGHAGIGYQFAPGQGGDTPGGGGAAVPGGLTYAVEYTGEVKGFVLPRSAGALHRPGEVGWVGARRSGA